MEGRIGMFTMKVKKCIRGPVFYVIMTKPSMKRSNKLWFKLRGLLQCENLCKSSSMIVNTVGTVWLKEKWNLDLNINIPKTWRWRGLAKPKIDLHCIKLRCGNKNKSSSRTNLSIFLIHRHFLMSNWAHKQR